MSLCSPSRYLSQSKRHDLTGAVKTESSNLACERSKDGGGNIAREQSCCE